MHAIDLLRDPGGVAVRPIYVIVGDDPFLCRESLREIRRVVLPGEADELSVARFEGAEASLADVFDELRTLPFFSRSRLVVVLDADTFVTAHRKELEGYAEHPSSSGNLVLVVKTWLGTTRLAKLVEKCGLTIECKGPKDRELPPWLVHFAKARYHATLDSGAAELLVELVGPEVGLLVSEVEKLSVYVGTRGKIHRDDVARLVGAGRIETVWKVLEAATTGRGDLALDHLDGLLTAGESPVGLLSAMSFSLLKLYHAGCLRRRRMDLRDACAGAGIPTYPGAIEQTRMQHAHLGPGRVDRLPEMLLQADLDMKGASMLVPRTLLERLLVSLASPRLD
jgi:DNA polymerase III subunit delta